MPDSMALIVPKGTRQPPPHLPQEVRDLISDNFDSAYDIQNSFTAFKGVWSDGTTSFKVPDWVEFMERPYIKRNVLRSERLVTQLEKIYGYNDDFTVADVAPPSAIAAKLPVPCSLTYRELQTRLSQFGITQREYDEAIRDDAWRIIHDVLYKLPSAASKRRTFNLLMERGFAEHSSVSKTCQSCLRSLTLWDGEYRSRDTPNLCGVHYGPHVREKMISEEDIYHFELDFTADQLGMDGLYDELLFTLSRRHRDPDIHITSMPHRYLTLTQANTLAQMLTGDSDATWHELYKAQAQGRLEYSARMIAIHCYVICMKAVHTIATKIWPDTTRLTPDDTTTGKFGGIIPFPLVPQMAGVFWTGWPAEEIQELYWVMRAMLTDDDEWSTHVDHSALTTGDSLTDTEIAEQLAAKYIIARVAECEDSSKAQVLQKYDIQMPQLPEPVITPALEPKPERRW